jgi:hypothetical protein
LAAAEILRLRNRIEEVEGKLAEARTAAPPGSEKLSQGKQVYEVDFTFDSDNKEDDTFTWNYHVRISWDDLFYDVGPVVIDEARDLQLRTALNNSVQARSRARRAKDKQLKDYTRSRNFKITDHDFQTIKIQLIALGLIGKSERHRSVKDTSTYWCLTPFGDQRLTTLRAIPAYQEDDPTDPEIELEDDSA